MLKASSLSSRGSVRPAVVRSSVGNLLVLMSCFLLDVKINDSRIFVQKKYQENGETAQISGFVHFSGKNIGQPRCTKRAICAKLTVF